MSDADSSPYRSTQDGLRAAGRYLDEHARRLVSLLVTAEGIVVTLAPGDIRGAGEAVLLTHDDLRALAAQARTARGTGAIAQSPDPLFPTGYEDFLRAVGAVAAEQAWAWPRLVRQGDETILRYGSRASRQETVLAPADVEKLLNYAFNLRGRGSTPPTG